MPRVTDPSILAQLETSQSTINKGGGGMMGSRGGGKPMTAQQQAAAGQRQQTLNALAAQYSRVRGLYDQNLKGVGPSSLLEYLPLPRNKAFNSAAAGLSDLATAAFRVPGIGAQSDADAARMVAANQPSASDSDEAIEAKLANLRNRLAQAGVKIPGESASGWKVVR